MIKYNNAEFKLLDRNGKTIFDQSGESKFSEEISNGDYFKDIAGDRGYFRKKARDEDEKKIELVAFARSQGHNDYEGLGWILTIEYQTAELFAPVYKLRNIILSISLVLTILAVIPGLFISNYISKPLSKLEAAMGKIGKGDMGTKVDIKRNDEIGQLADTFNQMVEQRKQTEEALRVSERKYSNLVQQSPDAIISLDNIGNFLSFNPAAERVSGFSTQEVIGKHFTRVGILDKKSITKSLKEFGLVLTGAERQPFDLIITRKDKNHVHMEANGRMIKQKGRKAWIQVTIRDTTERRQAEQELEKLNKDLESVVWELRRANKELQEFAYITAHDLKTPLRGIGTLADWISTDYADKFDDLGKKQVRLLVEKSKQMSALIDGILQYSKLGHTSLEKRQVDLNTLLSDIIDGVDPPENIEITLENELPALICDKTQIIQVFQNLLSNAVKYMDKPEGQIKVGCVEQDGFWKFSFADNGPGIDEKYHKKIFKIFHTLSPQDRIDSTGIGLSIVKKIVELNAGVVWVESELGEGSTFFFTVPKSGIYQEVLAGSTAEQV